MKERKVPRKDLNILIFRIFAKETQMEEKCHLVEKSVSLSSHVKNRQFLDMRDGKIRRSSCLYRIRLSKFQRNLYNTVGHFSSVFSVISGRLAMPITSGKAEKFPHFSNY